MTTAGRTATFAVVVLVAAGCGSALAETMSGALSRAYDTSPELMAQRADTRATDENLTNAKSGYRPTIQASADGGLLREQYHIPIQGNVTYKTRPTGYNLQISQNLFNGFQTQNRVNLALYQILSSRESLRYSELNVLANAAAAYMHVLRDTAVLDLKRNNTLVLREQLADTQTRLRLGEVTRTDLSQAQAALSQSLYDQNSAVTTLKGSIAQYRQLIGLAPTALAPARIPTTVLAKSLDEAYEIAHSEHPLVQGARRNVESNAYAVKVAEGALLPTLNATASTGTRYNYLSVEGQRYQSSEVGLQLNAPIYDGGVTYSDIRAAKEKLAEAQSQYDQQDLQVRASVEASWAAYTNSRTAISAARAEVQQSEKALAGVREEARLGQRTTQDVLYAQQYLVNARVLLVNAQADAVIAAYSLLASEGRLSAEVLGLAVKAYSPITHYEKVKDKWFGLDP